MPSTDRLLSSDANAPPKAVLFLQLAHIPDIQPKALYSAALQMYIGWGSVGVLGDWTIYWEEVVSAVKHVDLNSLVKKFTIFDPTSQVIMFQDFLSYLNSKQLELKVPNVDSPGQQSIDYVNPPRLILGSGVWRSAPTTVAQ